MPSMIRAALAIAVVTVLLGAPAAEAKVPDGFYGVMWDRASTRATAAEQDQQWALMAQSGVQTARAVVSWANAQPVQGNRPDLSETDELVALAARHGIELLPIVLETPGWAARSQGAGAPPGHIGAYTAFLRTLVLRYGPTGAFWDEHPELPRVPVRAWQIWNEPHLGAYWKTDGDWAREYARLLKASKPAVESVDPGATVVLAGLADFAWKHLTRLNRFRIRRYFDVAALNFFTSRPANVMKAVRLLRRVLRRGGARRKPVWITETTWPAGQGRVPVPEPAWQRDWYTTDEGMAKRVRQLYALAARNRRRLRLQRVYWYTWASAYDDGDLFDYAGLNRFSGGVFETRPALEAYAASARRFQR
jgi:hypothetical protein